MCGVSMSTLVSLFVFGHSLIMSQHSFRPWPLLFCITLLLLAFFGVASPLAAQEEPPYEVDWELAAHENGTLVAVLWVTPPEGMYFYSHSPGGMGQPTKIIPQDSAIQSVGYPIGEEKPDIFDPTTIIRAHESRTPFFLELADLQAPVSISATLRLLLCSSTACLPINDPVAWHLEALPAPLPGATDQPWWEIFQAAEIKASPVPAPSPASPDASGPAGDTTALAADAPWSFEPTYFQASLEVQSLGKALLFALLAGIILNAMPCVLPVVSLKLSALIAVTGEEDRATQARHFRQHAIWFAVGIFCFFVLLGGVFGAVGLAWGQLFQQSELILGLAVLLFALGLSLFGVFNLPMIDLKGQNSRESGVASPRLQAFSTGMLATLLATPCSGPLLGGVLGWTLSRSPAIILPVFVTIGLGMALPYLFLARWPGLVRKLPKAGAWCLHLERGMGFLLMGTTIYLVYILPQSLMFPALVCLWVAAVAAWMWGQWTTLSQPAGLRWGIRSMAALLLAGTISWALAPAPPSLQWEAFSRDNFVAAMGQDPLLVDFTADWCPNCKVLESTVLHDEAMRAAQARYGIRIIQVDLTHDSPDGMALLQSLGSHSIPVVALFPAGEAVAHPLVLRDLFTSGQLEEAMAQTFTAAP